MKMLIIVSLCTWPYAIFWEKGVRLLYVWNSYMAMSVPSLPWNSWWCTEHSGCFPKMASSRSILIHKNRFRKILIRSMILCYVWPLFHTQIQYQIKGRLPVEGLGDHLMQFFQNWFIEETILSECHRFNCEDDSLNYDCYVSQWNQLMTRNVSHADGSQRCLLYRLSHGCWSEVRCKFSCLTRDLASIQYMLSGKVFGCDIIKRLDG